MPRRHGDERPIYITSGKKAIDHCGGDNQAEYPKSRFHDFVPFIAWHTQIVLVNMAMIVA